MNVLEAAALGRARVAVVGAVLAFSTSGVLAKLSSAPAPAFTVFVRLSSLVLLAAAGGALRLRGHRIGFGRDATGVALIGGVIFAVHVLCYFSALKRTSVADVFLLSALTPALVGFAGHFFLGERLGVRFALWTALAMAGSALVITGSVRLGGGRIVGDLLAVGSTAAYCGYFLASKVARRTMGTLAYMLIVTGVAVVLLAAAVLATDPGSLALGPRDLLLAAAIGALPGTLGHLLVNWALRFLSASWVSVALLAVPVCASTWAAAVLGEGVSPWQLAGGALVLLGIERAMRAEKGAWGGETRRLGGGVLRGRREATGKEQR